MEEPQKKQKEPLIDRLHRTFGPLAGGMLLDLVDLSSFGPYGFGGFIVGALVAWWICSLYKMSTLMRFNLALLAGVYCLFPLTEFLPLATILSAIIRFRQKSG